MITLTLDGDTVGVTFLRGEYEGAIQALAGVCGEMPKRSNAPVAFAPKKRSYNHIRDPHYCRPVIRQVIKGLKLNLLELSQYPGYAPTSVSCMLTPSKERPWSYDTASKCVFYLVEHGYTGSFDDLFRKREA